MRKIVAVMLSIAVLFAGYVPNVVYGGTTEVPQLIEGNYVYTVDTGKVTIVKYNASSADFPDIVNVPSVIASMPVVKIGDTAFASSTSLNTNLTTVVIPSSVESIGDAAFWGISSLKTVVIQGNNLKSIGSSAFAGCAGLDSIALPDSVTTIGSYAFSGATSIKNLTLSANVLSIGVGAFSSTDEHLLLDAPYGSYAQLYAQKYNLKYTVPVTSLTLDSATRVLSPKQTIEINAIVNGGTISTQSGSVNSSVSWSSSNSAVASVDSAGTVTANADGVATIKATTVEGGFTSTCVVTVKTALSGVTMNRVTANLHLGKALQLSATYLPADTAGLTSIWTSSDPSVAVVSSSGQVTGLSTGKATITVTMTDGLSPKMATCEVTVVTGVSGVSLNPRQATLEVTKEMRLTPMIQPMTATTQSVKWFSSNTAVATVDSTGLVKAVGSGTTTVTVITDDGNYTDTCVVTVNQPLKELKLNIASFELDVTQTETLTATFTPTDASNKSVIWTSSKPEVAKVDATGKVTGVSNGIAKITAKSVDGNYTATSEVLVTTGLRSISLNRVRADLQVGGSIALAVSFYPVKSSNTLVSWESSNTTVATVDSKGVVKALKDGTAVISVKSDSGGKVAYCKVVVYTPITAIQLSSTALSLEVGSTSLLKATLTPKTASASSVFWKSSNTAVATVDSTGKITAKSQGTVTIQAATENGAVLSKCTVTVIPKITSLKLNVSSVTLKRGVEQQLKVTYNGGTAVFSQAKWTTSNKSIVTVSSTGKIKAVKAGVAYITVTNPAGTVKTVCKVTVK